MIYVYEEGCYSNFSITFARSDLSREDFEAAIQLTAFDGATIVAQAEEGAIVFTNPAKVEDYRFHINVYRYVTREDGEDLRVDVRGDDAERLLRPAASRITIAYLRSAEASSSDWREEAEALAAWIESKGAKS